METSSEGFPRRRTRAILALLAVGATFAAPASAEIFTSVLDPRDPSFAAKTELADTIVVAIDQVRGNPAEPRRKVRRSKGAIACAAKGKGAKAGFARLFQDKSVSVCVEYASGILRLRSRRGGTDSLVDWIPVRLSEMPRSSIEKARLVVVGGSSLLELELRERGAESEGPLDDRSLVLIDPARERFLVNVMFRHNVEGSRDEGNYTESCEGVAAIRGDRIVLGGYACQEESEGESPSGEVTSYTRSTGPDPEFTYLYRDGFLFQER